MMNLRSERKNGKAMKKSPNGMTKNWFPPHAETEKVVNIPANTSLENTIFLFSDFIPLNSKYNARRAKNNPNGSDLNHPIGLLIKRGIETEYKRAENKPADVPPITLTNAKITIADNDANIAGNKIVKSYKFIPPPKIQNE